MRRKDRQVTNRSKIQEIIASCDCCRLGIQDNAGIYVVPMSFGYESLQGVDTFYFHSANTGRKIDLLRQNPRVGFEMDTHYQLKTAATPCGYSAQFQSIIGTGTVSFLEDIMEKRQALSIIMRHYTEKFDWEFSEERLESVCVFRLTADTLSCKEHK